ncbi:DUF3231 family protein [Salibacterium qingdaonense]|uniref:DUF3231 family protein n=1 Tax=Salibacterium qingdaonense TaxID=266892 RepID=A0A1I4R467_9BACI|nr:DUF3231 family protein [Salibacterium qingdaonense]SFM46730.1 Protein of unknown function [Salibacterium qingdaonense]
MAKRNISLTSVEISQLWVTYMNDCAAICHLVHELNTVKDDEIKEILQYAKNVSESHVNSISQFFMEENYPVPYGFNLQKDVDISAPRLFTDIYYLNTLNQLGKIGLNNYSMAVSLVVREDIYQFFSACLKESDKIIKWTNDVLLSKGLYNRPPYLPKPETFDYVKDQGFLTGYLGERRPLTGIEISNLYANFLRNALGSATMMGYSQVAQNDEVAQYFLKGKEIAQKHCAVFESYLKKNDLPSPMMLDSEVTESTTYIFSDKKMMFYSSTLTALSLGYYGSSMSMSPRRDIGVMYGRLMAEIAKFSNSGAKIMIKHGWMEEPPRAADRDELADNH